MLCQEKKVKANSLTIFEFATICEALRQSTGLSSPLIGGSLSVELNNPIQPKVFFHVIDAIRSIGPIVSGVFAARQKLSACTVESQRVKRRLRWVPKHGNWVIGAVMFIQEGEHVGRGVTRLPQYEAPLLRIVPPFLSAYLNLAGSDRLSHDV